LAENAARKAGYQAPESQARSLERLDQALPLRDVALIAPGRLSRRASSRRQRS
jgi:hypothetical protein